VYRFLIALGVMLLPGGVRAQEEGLRGAAERARHAWFSHDPVALVAQSPRLLVQLPGADPSAALGPAQAAALLGDFIASAQEVETVVRAAREVSPALATWSCNANTGWRELRMYGFRCCC
jgi:hypothetical protein